MKSWDLNGIAKSDRRNFIVNCLQEYINTVNTMDIRDSPYIEHIEICNIADFYQAIIEELSTAD